MARVNHRRIKELIAEKRKTITDRQFFSSRILAGHFSDIAMAQTRRYNFTRRVKVSLEWKPKNPHLACTMHDVIWINTGHELVTQKKTREERYNVITGLFAHELGHVFYTPFPMAQTHANFYDEFKWYPEKPTFATKEDRKNEASMWKYCKDKPEKKAAMLTLLHEVHNIIEDGYIESRMLDRYPGLLGFGLTVAREAHFESAPTLTQMIEMEADGFSHIWQTIEQLILYYVKWGEIKYGEEPMTDERLQVIFSLLGDFDKALISKNPKDRFRCVNTVVIRCWPYISDFLDNCEADASSTGASISSVVASKLSSLAGATVIATGSSAAVSDGSTSVKLSEGEKRAETAKTASEAGLLASEEGDDEDETEEETEDETPAAGTPEDDDSDEMPEPEQNFGEHQEDGLSEVQDVSSEEMGRIKSEQTNQLYEPTGGSTELDDEYTGSGYTHSAEDVHQLLEEMAEKEATVTLETERTVALNALAQSISYGDIHSGCSFKVHRMADITDDMVDDYRTVAPELLHISKLLKRSILQQLQDKQKGGKQTGLMMGRKLDSKALHRKDGRPFYKNSLPNDRPEMAVGLLLDESGSMRSCHRTTYARASAIIMYDFCHSLGIPVMVYGHSTDYNCVDLYSYAEFDAIDRDDCFRMMDISARSGNRDGAALRFVADQLSKRSEDFRLLILVSDGQPADTGYGGTAAEEELRGIKHEYQRKGITFVAAAIGDDKEDIKRIYGDSFMDITDLNKMPAKLTEVVKRSLRV